MEFEIHRVASAADLFAENEVLNIGRMHLPNDIALGGVSWLVVDSPASEALLSVLRYVYSLIGGKLPSYQLWLLVGNSAWQPDTRIVRHYKLWGGLKARGIEISHVSDLQEVMRESEGKLKFFGAAQLSELSVASVVKALLEERCTYLVALPSNLTPQAILEIGWTGELAEDSSVITRLNKSGAVLIKQLGKFDDKERGVVAIGQPDIMKLLQPA